MKVRLLGRAAEVAALTDLLHTIVVVNHMSRDHDARDAAHRHDRVRRYLDVSLYGEAEDPDPTAPRCPWCRLPFVLDQHGPAMGGMSWSCRRCGRMYVAADAGIYLAEAVDPATVQVGDWVLLPAGWRIAFDVRVTAEEVQVRTDVPTDPLTGFRLRRVLTHREVKPWHDGPTGPNTVYVVRAGQHPEVGL